MSRHDKAALWLIAFFVAAALTIELYWLCNAFELPTRHSLFARGFRFYGIGDRGYWDHVSWFEVGLESFHICITVPLYLWLAGAIVTRSRYRWPLQLGIGAYVSYSVVLYLTAKYAVGYADMPTKDFGSFLILYVPNLPWLFGNLYLALVAGRTILAAVRTTERTG